MRKQRGAFWVGDENFESAGAALSYAQGIACRWQPANEERSFYVRDAFDNVLYRVDRDAAGVVLTYTL